MPRIDWNKWARPTEYVLAEDLQAGRHYVILDTAVLIEAVRLVKRRDGTRARVQVTATTSQGFLMGTKFSPSDLVPVLPSSSAQYKINAIDHDRASRRIKLWLELVEGPSQRFGEIYVDDEEFQLRTEILTCWDARSCDAVFGRLPAKNLRKVDDWDVWEGEDYSVVVTLTDVYTVEGSRISNIVVCWSPRI
jgi:hypothetical protein